VGISRYIQSIIASIDDELAKPQQEQRFVLVAHYGILDGQEHGNVLIRDGEGHLIQSPHPTIGQIAKFDTTEEAEAARAAWLLRYPTATVDVMEYEARLRQTRAFLARQIDGPSEQQSQRAAPLAAIRAAVAAAIALTGFALTTGYTAAEDPDLSITRLDSKFTPFFVDGNA
jgi:hypothetical protein